MKPGDLLYFGDLATSYDKIAIYHEPSIVSRCHLIETTCTGLMITMISDRVFQDWILCLFPGPRLGYIHRKFMRCVDEHPQSLK